MITLGIDPGTALLGYGVITGDTELEMMTYGAVATPSGRPMPERLVVLYDGVRRLLSEWRPDVLAVEQLFFARNVTTALAVGQARGVVLLAAAQAGVPVTEYTPTEVKQAVVGYGRASKAQVQEMVRLMLNLAETPQPDDAADALAVAICHARTAPFLARAAEMGEL